MHFFFRERRERERKGGLSCARNTLRSEFIRATRRKRRRAGAAAGYRRGKRDRRRKRGRRTRRGFGSRKRSQRRRLSPLSRLFSVYLCNLALVFSFLSLLTLSFLFVFFAATTSALQFPRASQSRNASATQAESVLNREKEEEADDDDDGKNEIRLGRPVPINRSTFSKRSPPYPIDLPRLLALLRMSPSLSLPSAVEVDEEAAFSVAERSRKEGEEADDDGRERIGMRLCCRSATEPPAAPRAPV